jgi:hypothetical protein
MSNYYPNYSQYLAATACCNNPMVMAGPQGPSGSSSIGPTGFTGAPGQLVVGPTGKPRRGPTGPPGPPGGYQGPTGPIGEAITISFTTVTFNGANNSITIPTQTSALAYYVLNMVDGQNLNSILFATPLSVGYQAILFVYGPASPGSSYINSLINSPTFVSNIGVDELNLLLIGQNAILTMIYDGTKYNCSAFRYAYSSL